MSGTLQIQHLLFPEAANRGVQRPATLLKKETLAQVFSYEFCKVFKNTIFTEHLRTTASIFHETK